MGYNTGNGVFVLKKKGFFLSFTLSLCMLLCGCSGSSLCAYSTYAYFDTLTRWAYFSRAADKEREIWAQITAFADSVEKSLSLAQPQSAVSRFNAAAAGDTVEIDKIAYDVLKLAQEAYAQTDGAYNPAVGIYIDLWGFSPRCTSANYRPTLPYDRADYTTQLPDEKYVEAFQPLTDFSAVRVWEEAGAYYVYKPDLAVEAEGEIFTMALNLGGIAKGYCADVCAPLVRAAGYDTGYLAFGTSSLALFGNALPDAVHGDLWSVGVRAPRGGEHADYMDVYLKDTVLSSSGDSELYYEWKGVRYCHIIDPQTGRPVNGTGEGVICATVGGLSGALGDAVTTALHVMGRDGAIAYAREKLSDQSVSFVCDDGSGNLTLYTNLQEGDYRLWDETMRTVKL